jgi:hypothetical protein
LILKIILFCGSALIAVLIALLLIATSFKTPLISNQYCKKIYTTIKQCVPGCDWQLHEDIYKGIDIEQDSTAFFPQNEPTCEGR